MYSDDTSKDIQEVHTFYYGKEFLLIRSPSSVTEKKATAHLSLITPTTHLNRTTHQLPPPSDTVKDQPNRVTYTGRLLDTDDFRTDSCEPMHAIAAKVIDKLITTISL